LALVCQVLILLQNLPFELSLPTLTPLVSDGRSESFGNRQATAHLDWERATGGSES